LQKSGFKFEAGNGPEMSTKTLRQTLWALAAREQKKKRIIFSKVQGKDLVQPQDSTLTKADLEFQEGASQP